LDHWQGMSLLSRLAELPRSFIRGPLARLPAQLPALTPPMEFACRIEKLPEGCADIDNDLYGDAAHASTWHSDDTSHELATLQLLNAARIPYFDRVWRQQLMLSPARPGTFCEIGCGGGIATGGLAGLGYHMTGVEPAAASLEAAREHARRLGLQERMCFVQGDAYDLSMFPDNCFDGIVMADVLEHLYDLPAAIGQLWRVLRPGGVFLFDTINRSYPSYVLAIALAQEGLGMVPPRTHDWRLFIKPHELSFLLQAHGFCVDTSHFRGLAPGPGLPNPLKAVEALRQGRAPRVPLGPFVEISSLQVNYMGFAIKPEMATGEPPWHAPGELTRGLREASRTL